MSLPGEKDFPPLPLMIIHLKFLLLDNFLNTEPNSFHIGFVKAFNFSGRFNDNSII